jgi:hypothetical protein
MLRNGLALIAAVSTLKGAAYISQGGIEYGYSLFVFALFSLGSSIERRGGHRFKVNEDKLLRCLYAAVALGCSMVALEVLCLCAQRLYSMTQTPTEPVQPKGWTVTASIGRG